MPGRFAVLILLAILGACAVAPRTPAPVPPERVWAPADPPRAVLVALHGFGDHKDAFAALGLWLAARGYRFVAFDQPGFGEQPDRLFWPGTETLVATARAVLARERAQLPDRPLFLLGESMGAAVALLVATDPDAPPLDGLVLVAPAVWGGEALPGLFRAAAKALAAILPWLRLSGRGLPVQPAEDPDVVRALARDPLHIGEPRADAVAGLVALMDAARATGPRLRTPVLMVVPGRDSIVPTRVQLSFAPTIASERCLLLVYPRARHLILRDRGREEVFEDLRAWLEGGAIASERARDCREAEPR
ncbi:MAG: alpha/beta fold hydrolase [Geminicoccaceae bacterium]|nr:lysophospholipase [Geminicoccaceae bacterium]MDW8125894.1 alpha/beta fold hydrolase [Geminicoccaceae bacterium]